MLDSRSQSATSAWIGESSIQAARRRGRNFDLGHLVLQQTSVEVAIALMDAGPQLSGSPLLAYGASITPIKQQLPLGHLHGAAERLQLAAVVVGVLTEIDEGERVPG